MDSAPTRSFEELALQRLGHRLKLIAELEAHERGTRWDLALSGSALSADDARARPFQVTHLVGHCLAMSLDALTGARLLLQDPEADNRVRLLMAAPYPMLRSAVEAGALATWVLMPDDRAERLARVFRARWDDIVNDDNMVLAFTAERAGDSRSVVSEHQRQRRQNAQHVRKVKNALRAVSDAAGVDRNVVEQGLPGFGPIVEQAALATGVEVNYVHGLWRMVSGLTHPSASRSIALSSIELFESPEPGVSHAALSARPALVNMAIEAAFLFHVAVLRRTVQLGGNHEIEFSLPADFPRPPRAD